MRYSTAALSALAAAPYALAATHNVEAGYDGRLVFNPETVTAAVGDVVVFYWLPGGHSVAQGDYSSPCSPSSDDAFWSGYFPGQKNDMDGPSFQVTVNSTDPMWFYCATASHCPNGMVGVINPPSSGDSLDTYKKNAQGASASALDSVQGGLVVPAGKAASSSATSASSAQSSAASSISSAASSASSSLSSAMSSMASSASASRASSISSAASSAATASSTSGNDSGAGQMSSGGVTGGIIAAVMVLVGFAGFLA